MFRALRHPTRLLPAAFVAALLAGTGLLMLPAARATGEPAPPLVALFTAASSVFITGMSTVDTGDVLVAGRSGHHPRADPGRRVRHHDVRDPPRPDGVPAGSALRTRLVAQAETRSLNLGEVAGAAAAGRSP